MLLTICRDPAAIQRLEIAADRYRHKLLTAGFEARDKVIDTMPGFWPIALRNSAALLRLAAIDDDTKALQFLKKVKAWRDPEQIQTFGFEFVRFFLWRPILLSGFLEADKLVMVHKPCPPLTAL